MEPFKKAFQFILVSRQDTKNKLLAINEIETRTSADSNWPQLLIFPEGTTTNRSCLISFKHGAFIPALPVQPIIIQYNNKLDTITWTWEGFNALEVVFYTLCQLNNYMEVTYLPVYAPNIKEKINPKLFASNVRSKIAELVG